MVEMSHNGGSTVKFMSAVWAKNWTPNRSHCVILQATVHSWSAVVDGVGIDVGYSAHNAY